MGDPSMSAAPAVCVIERVLLLTERVYKNRVYKNVCVIFHLERQVQIVAKLLPNTQSRITKLMQPL
jgi:hypothetical protein